ncbi:MAG: geranylgeranyl reductase family protein [Acidimicrobiales bacterium]|nr:geranylgeranyl reductase family protein [Acidimicrobiales bacterium]
MSNGGRFDAAVIGAGPAGSVAALVLARAGAKVALVDKATFPRDKACGDLIGPRGVALLDDLGVLPEGLRLGPMDVVGPTGRVVRLPAPAGRTYPGYAIAVSRRRLDAGLRDAALEAGAEGVTARATSPLWAHAPGSAGRHLAGFRLETRSAQPRDLQADVVIGADGALSRVAASCGLVDDGSVLWGFALRGYADEGPRRPRLAFWEPAPWAGYPGYAWEFPGEGGAANMGIGAARRGSRRFAARIPADLEAYRISRSAATPLEGQLGGWLKIGMVGTTPARGRTLLIGDAAGLVNPLQGEGIGPAVQSAQLAAEAVLAAGPEGAAARYVQGLDRRFGSFASQTAPVAALMLRRPRLTAAAGRLLTAPGVGRALAGAWALYWNDLVDGAAPGLWPAEAALVTRLGAAATASTADHRWIRRTLAAPSCPGDPVGEQARAYDRPASGHTEPPARAEGGR